MRDCCDRHQNCYHKCLSNKNQCDQMFENCLMDQCIRNYALQTNQVKSII